MPLAVPVPITWTVGEVVTASQLNGLRDALDYLLNPPIFAATQTSATTPWTTWSVVGVQSVSVDTYSGYSSSNGGYIAQVAGYYQTTGVVCYAQATTGFRSAGVQVNSTRVPGSIQDLTPDSDFPCVASVPVTVYLNVGDLVQLVGYVGGGTNVGTSASHSDIISRLDVRWVHA